MDNGCYITDSVSVLHSVHFPFSVQGGSRPNFLAFMGVATFFSLFLTFATIITFFGPKIIAATL